MLDETERERESEFLGEEGRKEGWVEAVGGEGELAWLRNAGPFGNDDDKAHEPSHTRS